MSKWLIVFTIVFLLSTERAENIDVYFICNSKQSCHFHFCLFGHHNISDETIEECGTKASAWKQTVKAPCGPEASRGCIISSAGFLNVAERQQQLVSTVWLTHFQITSWTIEGLMPCGSLWASGLGGLALTADRSERGGGVLSSQMTDFWGANFAVCGAEW